MHSKRKHTLLIYRDTNRYIEIATVTFKVAIAGSYDLFNTFMLFSVIFYLWV